MEPPRTGRMIGMFQCKMVLVYLILSLMPHSDLYLEGFTNVHNSGTGRHHQALLFSFITVLILVTIIILF
jgi:hypothetical protein